jgi:bis(5'-nucleosyl)-tetraphosphatase (symmetrical)
MSTYVVGDVQGCASAFNRLLTALAFDPSTDHIIFAGDLIARGDDSLAVMQWVLEHQHACSAVLGNHDLNFLAVASGLREPKGKDKTTSLLESPICDAVIDWYRQRPLALDLPEHNALVVHAGVWPLFDRSTLLHEIQLVHQRLQSEIWVSALESMYGNCPDHYDHAKTTDDQARFLINACTRMRFVNQSTLALDFSCKDAPEFAPAGCCAWMDAPHRTMIDRQILFGHWATLNGRKRDSDAVSLDTGCVWGGYLSAICLDNRKLIQVESGV